jgi:hypothetical protein
VRFRAPLNGDGEMSHSSDPKDHRRIRAPFKSRKQKGNAKHVRTPFVAAL